MLPATVNLLEIAWVGMATVGLIWNWWLWRDAIRSRHYWQTQAMNGAVDISTRSNERSSGVRALVQFLFLIVGLTAMTFPDTPDGDVDPSWIVMIPAVGFIVVEVVLVVDSILARRDRERLINMEVERKRKLAAQHEH